VAFFVLFATATRAGIVVAYTFPLIIIICGIGEQFGECPTAYLFGKVDMLIGNPTVFRDCL